MNDIETALSQIENFQFIHEHLFSSGQPTTAQLQLMKEYGVSTVINVALTDNDQYLPHEDKICLELGLNYIQVPISWETPSDNQCLLVLELINHLIKEQAVIDGNGFGAFGGLDHNEFQIAEINLAHQNADRRHDDILDQ